MRVLNIHERELRAGREEVGRLIDSLASPGDALWPRSWPPMRFDRPLSVGADGGHGPIRYVVAAYAPGRSIRFRFTGPKGFEGGHRIEVVPSSVATVVLRHTLQMDTRGLARISWPLVFRPLHDALIEDALATAQTSLGLPPDVRPWPPWVRLLRRAMTGGRATPQRIARSGAAG